jgi:hypothetical protein
VREARDATGVADGDGLGDGVPTVGDGLALGLGLGDAVPGDRLALGRLVRSGAGVVWWACGWAVWGVAGADEVLGAGESPAAGDFAGATST